MTTKSLISLENIIDASQGKIDDLKTLLENGANPNTIIDGCPILIHMLRKLRPKRNIEITQNIKQAVDLFLKAGANPRTLDWQNHTAFFQVQNYIIERLCSMKEASGDSAVLASQQAELDEVKNISKLLSDSGAGMTPKELIVISAYYQNKPIPQEESDDEY